jgi:hypothetical protein
MAPVKRKGDEFPFRFDPDRDPLAKKSRAKKWQRISIIFLPQIFLPSGEVEP